MTYDPSGNPPPGQYPPYPGGPGQVPASGGYGSPSGSPPPAYRAWSIASIVYGFILSFFGMFFGIVATVFAFQVRRKWEAGDYAGAQRSSQLARTWAIVATVVTVVIFLLGIIIRH